MHLKSPPELFRSMRDKSLLGNRKAALEEARDALRVIHSLVPKEQIACKPGCSYCCHIPVTLTSAEAEVIATAVRRNKKIDTDSLISRLRDRVESTSAQTLEQLKRTMNRCVFLEGGDTSGQCTIHKDRPLSCRAFGSPDVSICKDAYEGRPAPMTSVPQELMIVGIGGEALGGKSRLAYELHNAVLAHLEGRSLKNIAQKEEVEPLPDALHDR